MKIAVLSRNTQLYSTQRLEQACLARGHQVKILDPMAFSVYLEGGKPNLFYCGEPVERLDAIIPRIGASITLFGTAVVRQLEQMGMFCLNTSQGISMSRDKLCAMQILSRHAIGIPATAFVKRREDVLPAIEAMGGAPVIIKLLEGTQGVGVILADSNKVAQTIVETLQSTRHNVLIQKFVKESGGSDIRAFVVGGRVVAAIRRAAQPGEFRSNVHLGGKAEGIRLNAEFERTAIRATQIVGLNVAGVDILESKEGPKVLEVNSSPGLEGIEQATGVDVAGAIVSFLEEQALVPDIDVRQRLTLDRGYGVAEIVVDKTSPIAHKTITGSQLRQRDIVVMSVLRGNTAIPNPRSSREILPGDILVCFGKLSTLKEFLQNRKPRKTGEAS